MTSGANHQNIHTAPDRSRTHYRNFHNIFLYITERCQLRCGHCYMGDRLERGSRLPLRRGTKIMRFCHSLGARYITFLGGEPTLHPDLPLFVDAAASLGYSNVMVDTNGLLLAPLLKLPSDFLSYISVSLDGATAATHDRVRGAGTFSKTVETIRCLAKAGYSTRLNCTVFAFNVHEALGVLTLADDLGVELVNFHTFSEEGYGRHKQEWSLSPEAWIRFYENLEEIRGSYRTSIWYPPTWATDAGLRKLVEKGFNGCLGTSLDRLSIFPDGRCYICSVLFDEAVHFATVSEDGFRLNNSNTNELDLFLGAAFTAEVPSASGCPAEQRLGAASQDQGPRERLPLTSVFRCWKVQA